MLHAKAESPNEKWDLAYSQGIVELLVGRHDEAARFFDQVIALRKRMGQDQHPWAAFDFKWAARNLSMNGKFDEAESLLSSAPTYGAVAGGGPDSAGYEAVIPRVLAAIKLERGDPGTTWKLLPPDSTDFPSTWPFDDQILRGEILCRIGRRSEGLELLERVLKAQDGQVYMYHPALARARAVTGLCALSLGQHARAKGLAALARDAFTAQPNVSPYFKAPLKELERKL